MAKQLGFNLADATFAQGQVKWGGRSVALQSAARERELVGEDKMEYGDLAKRFAQQTFGAHFAEVAVDAYTGEIRIRRMLAVCAAGRIINPKTARSQIIGGMTMGAGAALMEDMVVDKRVGYFVNHDLAGYEGPVHADIPHLDAIFLDEADATANAVYNATGIRVREYPITLDKLIGELPKVA